MKCATKVVLWLFVVGLIVAANLRLIPTWSKIWGLRDIELGLGGGFTLVAAVTIFLRVASLHEGLKCWLQNALDGWQLPATLMVFVLLLWLVFYATTDVEGQAENFFSRYKSSFETGDYCGALENLDRAILLHPLHARYYYTRGVLYELLGRRSEATDDYHQARLLDIDLQSATTRLANFYVDDGKCEQAVKLFFAPDPGTAPALDYEASVAVARGYVCLELYVEAKRSLGHAIDKYPSGPEAHYYLGVALEGLDDPGACEEFKFVYHHEQADDVLRGRAEKHLRTLKCALE